ncbi:hypothetical protein D3C80_1908210 [compost metagenome]
MRGACGELWSACSTFGQGVPVEASQVPGTVAAPVHCSRIVTFPLLEPVKDIRETEAAPGIRVSGAERGADDQDGC